MPTPGNYELYRKISGPFGLYFIEYFIEDRGGHLTNNRFKHYIWARILHRKYRWHWRNDFIRHEQPYEDWVGHDELTRLAYWAHRASVPLGNVAFWIKTQIERVMD